MAREHPEKKKEEAPLYLEREVNLSLLNQKLNEVINILYKLAEKADIKVEEN